MSDLTTINRPTYTIDQFELLPTDAAMENLMAHYHVVVSQASIDLPGGLETETWATILFINKSNHDERAAINIGSIEADDVREELMDHFFDTFAREQDHNDPNWQEDTYDDLLYNSDAWTQVVDNLEELSYQINDGYNYIGVVDSDYKYIGENLHELFATVVYNWGHNLSMLDNPPRLDTGYLSVDGSNRG